MSLKRVRQNKEYIIFCDESDSSGSYYSNFYGGLLIGSMHYGAATERLNKVKQRHNLKGEVKWSKVTEQYLDHYMDFVDALFDEVEAGHVKIRIMFRHNAYEIPNLPDDEHKLTYFRLYYQFVKHAFGLQHVDYRPNGTRLRLYFDEFPETREKVAKFKDYIEGLGSSTAFRNAGIKLHKEDIAEVRSHDHVLLQGLDIVLGAMCFRLNNKHKIKPDGSRRRGRRTIAKEKLYKKIVARVCRIRPHFNFGTSTGFDDGPVSKWKHPYRHWCFRAYDSAYDETRNKSLRKKDCPSDPT